MKRVKAYAVEIQYIEDEAAENNRTYAGYSVLPNVPLEVGEIVKAEVNEPDKKGNRIRKEARVVSISSRLKSFKADRCRLLRSRRVIRIEWDPL